MTKPGVATLMAGLAGAALTVLLAGCGKDTPSDSLAAETVRKYADRDLHDGLVIAKFERENGWVDETSANRYNVRYNYQLQLAKPYAEVVLLNAKRLKGEEEQAAKTSGKGGFFDLGALQNGVEAMGQAMAVNQWIGNQGDAFAPRYRRFLAGCTPCAAWLSDEQLAEKERRARFAAFASSWGFFEDLGFKDEAVVGSGLPRQAWAAFMKTEKGWQAVQ